MDDIPPSYELATSRDPWKIIVHSIFPRDLYAACLVSRGFHQQFGAALWGTPHTIFNLDNEDAYSKLDHTDLSNEDTSLRTLCILLDVFESFLKALKLARDSTRSWTHTLDLSAIESKLTQGPDSDWLYAIMAGLPGLQSLLVSGQQFVDARSLRYLQFGDHTLGTARAPAYSTSMTRLANSSNITSSSLAAVLQCLPHLAYLDLSGTTAAKDLSIIQENCLPSLQILKLRNIGLTDRGLSLLAEELGTRVWSLDVRNNALTDKAIYRLLDYCFMPPNYYQSENLPHYEQIARSSIRSSAVKDDDEIVADQEATILQRLRRYPDRRALNRSRSGLSHIYISDNPVTSEAVVSLLQSTQLVVLDCGKISAQAPRDGLKVPGPRKETCAIVSAYEHYAQGRLKYLRIDHTCITGFDADQLDPCNITTPAPDRTPSVRHDLPSTGFVPTRLAVRCLVLTGIQSSSVGRKIPEALEGFLDSCALAEVHWASTLLDSDSIKEEPKQPLVRSQPEQHLSPAVISRPKPFLGMLVLEMKESIKVIEKSKTSFDLGNDIPAKLAEASKGDFSFFGGEKHDINPSNSAKVASNSHNKLQEVDVVTAIAHFRKARYMEHEAAMARGRGGPGAGGHWSGLVKVVRPPFKK
ncbi:MAG: hypothetical protein M1812_002151 [Candelaria pacifica]|nr:MAG: hypothetical protein M1812_002151 [Candelaria pacifica]